MNKSMLKNKTLHITPFSYITQGLDEKWEDYFHISKQDIKVHNQRMVTDRIVREMITDVSKRVRVHGWKGMRKLNLKLNKCESITDESLHAIRTQLQPHVSFLQNFSINLNACELITDNGLRDFNYAISRNLTRVKQTYFNYAECKGANEKSLRAIDFRLANKPSSMQDFTFSSSITAQITDKAVTTFCRKVLGYMQNLKRLSLDFSCCVLVTNQSLERLGNMLRTRFGNLEHLQLELVRFKNITEHGLRVLFEGFSPKLKSLSLDFSERFEEDTAIIDERISLIGECIGKSQYIKNLQKFTIDLTRCYDLKDNGFQSLFNDIVQKAPNLRQATFYFSFCYDVTSAVLDTIEAANLANRKKLKSLQFDFTGCHLIDTKKTEAITKKTRGAVKFIL